MKYWLIAALLLPGCKKKGPNDAGVSTKMKKPDELLKGRAMHRVRDLELQCTVEVAPEGNHVWVSILVINHGKAPQFVPSTTDAVWMVDLANRALYTVGSPKQFEAKPKKEPIYATLAPGETRTWTLAGAKSTTPLAKGPAQDFRCAVSQGPDGTHFLQAAGRALDIGLLR